MEIILSSQMKQMKVKDARVKQTNEILSGIKVLKLYAWEQYFMQKLQAIREIEIGFIKMSAYLLSGTAISFNAAPLLVNIH